MTGKLNGKRVAILVAQGFEESELLEPKKALEAAGAETAVISPVKGKVRGWKDKDWGQEVKVDLPLEEAKARHFDALLLPGGVMNPDKLRLEQKAIDFIRDMGVAGKPIAAICHGPWTLIDAGLTRGRRMTSYPSIKIDLINAGALWLDEEVVTDNGMVTSRKPSDSPAFNNKMIEEFAEGIHVRQSLQADSMAE